MTTLVQTLAMIARKLPESYEGVSTGGSSTSLTDTVAPAFPDNVWNGGTLFILSGTPRVNTSRSISDWVSSTRTWSIPADGGAAMVASQAYLVTRARWPRSDLVRAVNAALALQPIVGVNKALAPIADTLQYDLPSGVAGIVQVDVGTEADGWTPHYQWREQDSHLVFYANEPTTTTDVIRIFYYPTFHADVSLDAAVIDPQINIELLVFDALALLYANMVVGVHNPDPFQKTLAQQYEQKAQMLRAAKMRPQATAKLAG